MSTQTQRSGGTVVQQRFQVIGLNVAQLTQFLMEIGVSGRWRVRPADPHQQYDVGAALINFWPSTGTLLVQNDGRELITRILMAKGRPKIIHVPRKARLRKAKPSLGWFHNAGANQ